MKSIWYANLGIVSIGVQCGGPEDGGLGDIKVDLRKLLKRHCTKSYSSNVDHYALALRIDGEFQRFGKEGIEAIRRHKKERYIGADIIIPEAVWRRRSENALRDYLAHQVRQAVKLCVNRLLKDKEIVDESNLFREIDAAIAEFKKIDYE